MCVCVRVCWCSVCTLHCGFSEWMTMTMVHDGSDDGHCCAQQRAQHDEYTVVFCGSVYSDYWQILKLYDFSVCVCHWIDTNLLYLLKYLHSNSALDSLIWLIEIYGNNAMCQCCHTSNTNLTVYLYTYLNYKCWRPDKTQLYKRSYRHTRFNSFINSISRLLLSQPPASQPSQESECVKIVCVRWHAVTNLTLPRQPQRYQLLALCCCCDRVRVSHAKPIHTSCSRHSLRCVFSVKPSSCLVIGSADGVRFGFYVSVCQQLISKYVNATYNITNIHQQQQQQTNSPISRPMLNDTKRNKSFD